MIPDRAIASVLFGILSLFAFRFYAGIMWGTMAHSKEAEDAIGYILDNLEIARKVLAVIALFWCIWSWRKEWWLPSVIATLFTALALYMAFFVSS